MDPNKLPGKGRGRGQGSILEMMRKLQQEQTLSYSVETPSVETPSSVEHTRSLEESNHSITSAGVSLGRGRGMSIASRILQSFGNRNEEEPIRSSTPPVAKGRGFAKHLSPPEYKPIRSALPEVSAAKSADTEIAGVLEKLSDVSVYNNPIIEDAPPLCEESTEPICRQGTSGQRLDLLTNHIDLKANPNIRLYQYDVQYSPDIESQYLRRRLLNQHSENLGKTKIFDGLLLFLPIKLPKEVTRFQSLHPDGSEITLVVVYRKTQKMNENIHFFNILFNRVMRGLSLVRIGRQSFNPKGTCKFDSHRLEVWPGYVTSVNEYEGGLKVCIDIRHRVMRTETIRDLIAELFNRDKNTYKERAMNEIIGTSVLTRYNNKTYRIDDIDWDKTPKYKFMKNGQEMSLLEYYEQQWNIKIEDRKQPLLVHRSNVRTASGEKQERLVLLVPELSYAAGLTDNIRSNYKIMRDLSTVTKTSPVCRRQQIQKFIKEIEVNPVTRDVLAEWGLRLNHDVVKLNARRLDPEEIVFGRNNTFRMSYDRPSDWSSAAVKNPVLRSISLTNWHIVYWKKDNRCVDDFARMIMTVVGAVKMQFTPPKMVQLYDDRLDTYLRAINSSIESGIQLVTIVFSTNRSDRYSAVKKLCCVQKSIPSQVIIAKTISDPKKLKSVTEKIALQMNCKLGGALWTVRLPLRNSMVCGIDVFHSGSGPVKKSVAGFVASMDSQLTKWHSRICIQACKQELVDMLQMCLTSSLHAYKKHNGCNPERIFIFRDGVGDGDLDYVENYEVKQLRATFQRIASDYNPQLGVIVVQKRINTRFFGFDKRNDLTNPSAGTIVDSCVTRRNYYDFFLISQNTREGTVTPTHYIVLHDTTKLEPDHMQRLAYKLCHLYYNWPGTIRVPAPCQYAHKLVSLVGQNIQLEPHHSLSDLLYYL